MLFEADNALRTAGPRSKSLAISVGFHLVLLLLALVGPDILPSAARRVIHISGQDFEREPFELTELVLPPELMEEEPIPAPVPAPSDEPPPVAVVEPVLPIPVPEAAPPPPPPPPDPPPPEPEVEDVPAPPPPVIGPDDVIEEGARPDAPLDPGEGAPDEDRLTLDAATAESTPDPVPDGNDGDGGDGGDGDDDLEPLSALEPAEAVIRPEDEPDPSLARNTNPDALLLPDLRKRANVIVEETVAEVRRDISNGRRPGARGSGDETPDFSTAEPTILSDTRGYDFGPYMNQVVNRVRVNWYSLIPEAARLQQLRGRVVIIFTILKDGRVSNERIVAGADSEPLDRAAMGAIRTSNPFPRIPDDFDGDNLVLQFTFLYNMS